MNVSVLGALRFRDQPSLKRGLAAFDEDAYPELFTSAIWTVEGLCAFVETTTDGEQRPLSLDVEPDCDHERAFVAMAREAVDGCVDLLDARAAEEGGMFRRIHRRDVPRKEWFAESFGVGRTKAERTRALGFGRPVAKYRLTWAKAATKKGG